MNCILFRPHAISLSPVRYKVAYSRPTFNYYRPHFARAKECIFINEKRYYAKAKGDVELSVPDLDDPFDSSSAPPPSTEKLSPKFVQRLKKQKRLEQMSRRSMKEEQLTMPHVATPKILSNLFGVRTIDIFKVMIKLDLDPKTPDDTIDQNLADIMAEEFYFVPVRRELYDEFRPNKSSSDIRPRSPIVTVMGHVDHGKTTLLDALRHSSRASAEAGGITQHISAFEVEIGQSKATFIDTPGHEAFHEMRARGSSVADIVVLVISSDDGIQNQTVEILERLESSRTPFIVAITKIDKDTAHPERVYKQLMERGHKVEQLGGDLQCVHVSARSGLGLSELVDAINLQAEYLGVSCDHAGRGEGTVLEARKDRGRGYTATIIIRSGVMKLGASFVSGNMKGKIRSISDGAGRSLTSAGPCRVIEVSGFKDVVPAPGSDFVIVENDAQAHQLLEFRLQKKNLEEKVLEEMKIIEQDRAKNEIISRALEEDDTTILDSLIADDKKKRTEDSTKLVNFVLKVDVPGSIAALTEAIKVIPCAEHNIVVQLAYSGVGDVTESDIARAKATNSSLLCFNVSCPSHISLFARTEGVALYESKVIYNVIGHIAQTVEALLPPKIVSDPVGKATVKKVFVLHNRERSAVAGCVVDSGLVARKHRVRLMRGEELLVDGKLESLRNVKEDVREIKGGMECGMRISGWNDYKEGDIIECYSPRSVPTRLNFKQAQRRPSPL